MNSNFRNDCFSQRDRITSSFTADLTLSCLWLSCRWNKVNYPFDVVVVPLAHGDYSPHSHKVKGLFTFKTGAQEAPIQIARITHLKAVWHTHIWMSPLPSPVRSPFLFLWGADFPSHSRLMGSLYWGEGRRGKEMEHQKMDERGVDVSHTSKQSFTVFY